MPIAAKSTIHGPSFLRWAGSKRQSLALLVRASKSSANYYVEPFAGSAALFFSLQPRAGVLGDLNGYLINAMRHVRDVPADVHKALSRITRSPTSYYRVRDRFNRLKPYGLEAAVLFIYLNRNCFNGLWRTNSNGKFNVPFGGTEMGRNPPLELLEQCSLALRRVSLRHQDFRKTIAVAGRGSFIYADPPYFVTSVRTFVEYGKQSFGEADLSDLVSALVAAGDRGANVALTYSQEVPLADIPRSWKRTRFSVTRNVGGFRDVRRKHSEVLYTNCDLIQ